MSAPPRSTRRSGSGTASGPALPIRAHRAESTRRRIIDAAREVFFRRGYEQTNLDDVAGLARVAKGTLYVHFRNKAVLYLAVLTHRAGAFAEKMRAAAASASSPDDQIRAIARFYITHYRQRPEYFQIFWAMENEQILGSIPAKLAREVVRVFEDSLSVLEETIRRGIQLGTFRSIDPREAAVTLWVMANGLLRLQARSSGKTFLQPDFDRFARDAVDLFIAGLSRTAPPSRASR